MVGNGCLNRNEAAEDLRGTAAVEIYDALWTPYERWIRAIQRTKPLLIRLE